MNNEFHIFENFLSKDECLYVLNKCHEELTLETAGVASGKLNKRKSSVSWIDDLGDINIRIKDILRNSFKFNGAEATGFESFQFTEYKVGEYYDWHTDSSETHYSERFMSIVIQLNEGYDGGILEIKNVKGELIPVENKIGTLYIFNSRLLHRVTSVEAGTRYSLVNWVSLIKNNSKKQNLL
jgi:predicted 2-oxoglutarate/Fe(II)-dependent dioxygenase YbiX